MQRNPKYISRSPLDRASHSNTYDPSEPYRAMLMPPPPPAPVEIPPNNPYPPNSFPSQVVSSSINDQTRDNNQRIPQYYYPNYNEPNGLPSNRSYPTYPEETYPNSYGAPPVVEPSYPNGVDPYYQPVQISSDPYATGQFHPYSTPYLVPATNNISQPNHLPHVYEQQRSTIIGTTYPAPYVAPMPINISQVDPNAHAHEQARLNSLNSHQNEADLSRLEVYHFTPKQNIPITVASFPVQSAPAPVAAAYYPYSYSPPLVTLPPISVAPQLHHQPYSSHPYPWYGYEPYTHSSYDYPPYDYHPYDYPPYDYSPYDYSSYHIPHVSEPYRPFLPPIEKKARSSQTEVTPTKSRAVSPMHEHSTPYDSNGYPPIHQRVMLTNRFNDASKRSSSRHHNSYYATPLPDCRCIHCQRERAKVLNYYSD